MEQTTQVPWSFAQAGDTQLNQLCGDFTLKAYSVAVVYNHVYTTTDPGTWSDTTSYELGTRFSLYVPITCYGLRIFNPGLASVPGRVGHLYEMAGGTILNTVSLPNTMPAGWSEWTFPTPTAITTGLNYVASYKVGGVGVNDYAAISSIPQSNAQVIFDSGEYVSPYAGTIPNSPTRSFYGIDILYI